MEHVSHKLKNAIEGTLAYGGDPATSPLYVFGTFLKMLAAAGVAAITYGDSIWLVIITIAALLTTTATLVIFIERFLEGAWLYFILIPILFPVFTHYHARNSRTALTIEAGPAEI